MWANLQLGNGHPAPIWRIDCELNESFLFNLQKDSVDNRNLTEIEIKTKHFKKLSSGNVLGRGNTDKLSGFQLSKTLRYSVKLLIVSWNIVLRYTAPMDPVRDKTLPMSADSSASRVSNGMEIRELEKSEWPAQLLETPQPPNRLWIRGALPPAGHKLLTVVGSRAMTRYGQEACEKLITGLAGYPVSIVSGLALGVDTCAHKAALSAGLHTLAFPGSGLDDSILYPRSNRMFAKEILKAGGGMISEYAPDMPSHVRYFPERNRLMVGISDAVLVIEAGEKSGTLITARLASEYNRDLLCIPHRIGDPHAFGPHLFIRLGAALVSDSLHILEALHIAPRKAEDGHAVPPSDLEDAELVIWNMLDEPMTRDEILRGADTNVGELMTALVALELRGLIKEEFGAWHRI